MSLIIPSTFLSSAWARDLSGFLDRCGVPCAPGAVTDRRILDKGVSLACEEFCLPLKIFCGHVARIAESGLDWILIPVITGNTRNDSFLCHLQQRARDIILGLELIPRERVISPFFMYDDFLRLEEDGFHELGHMLGLSRETVISALAARAPKSESGSQLIVQPDTLRIALTGNPPVVEDAVLGGSVRRILADLGVVAEVPALPDFCIADYPKDTGHFSMDAFARAQIETALADSRYHGVVYVQAFLCGPGCSTGLDCGQLARTKPFLQVVLDQTQSSGGLETRLEAFLDMVKKSQGRQ